MLISYNQSEKYDAAASSSSKAAMHACLTCH